MWDEQAGYETSDPKHPDYHSLMSSVYDLRDKSSLFAVPRDDNKDCDPGDCTDA